VCVGMSPDVPAWPRLPIVFAHPTPSLHWLSVNMCTSSQAARENALFEMQNGMSTTPKIKKGW